MLDVLAMPEDAFEVERELRHQSSVDLASLDCHPEVLRRIWLMRRAVLQLASASPHQADASEYLSMTADVISPAPSPFLPLGPSAPGPSARSTLPGRPTAFWTAPSRS